MGALKGQKDGWSSLIKVRNFHLSHFGIMFEGGPEFFQELMSRGMQG